jgi:hypothetical protein
MVKTTSTPGRVAEIINSVLYIINYINKVW